MMKTNLELLEKHLNRCYRNMNINDGNYVAMSSLYSALRCVQEEIQSSASSMNSLAIQEEGVNKDE